MFNNYFKRRNNIKESLIKDFNNQDLMFSESDINKFRKRCDRIKNYYMGTDLRDHERTGVVQGNEFYEILRIFGKLLPLIVDSLRNNNINFYDECVKMIIDKMINNAKICQEKLIGINWITKNPGRQWTSSINPIIEDPREWYGKHYIPVKTGIPEDIETCLRLARLRSIWTVLPKEIFDKILYDIAECYADEAWQYIL